MPYYCPETPVPDPDDHATAGGIAFHDLVYENDLCTGFYQTATRYMDEDDNTTNDYADGGDPYCSEHDTIAEWINLHANYWQRIAERYNDGGWYICQPCNEAYGVAEDWDLHLLDDHNGNDPNHTQPAPNQLNLEHPPITLANGDTLIWNFIQQQYERQAPPRPRPTTLHEALTE